jgi:AcrR family transcriptional regulator
MARPRGITRAERAEAMRQAILSTAARLFLRSGIEATSLDAVAAELGVTKGAVYARFPSKGALVEAVAVAHSTPKTLVETLVEPGIPLARRVRTFGERLASSKVSRQTVLLDLEYVIYSARNARWGKTARAGFAAELGPLAARLREVNAATGDALGMPEERFLLLLNLLARGLVQQWVLYPGSLDREAGIRMMEQLARAASRA